MEHPLHHLPFLIACGIGVAALKLGDVSLQLRLSGQSGKARHGLIPIEVVGCLDDHKQSVAEDLYLHFVDTNTTDALSNLAPVVLTVVSLHILLNEFGVILQF